MTRAAETLRISQPSLSQQLKIFEAEVGEGLFIRSGRSFELSAKGKLLYEKSIELFEVAEAITETLNSADEEKRSAFQIGVSEEIERPFIAEIVGKLLRTRKGQKTRFAVVSTPHREMAADFVSQK